jgi:hypothetical protein
MMNMFVASDIDNVVNKKIAIIRQHSKESK